MLKKLIVCTSLFGLASVASVALPSTAQAGTCGSVASVSADIIEKHDSLSDKMRDADKIKEMIAFWNKMVGNSWAKIGPRRLDYGTLQGGTVHGPTSRLFIAGIPSEKQQAAVTFKKLDGKAKTSVTVCKVAKDGSQQKVWDFVIPAGGGTKTYSRTIKGLQGKVLTVHVNGHSATKKLKYNVKAVQR